VAKLKKDIQTLAGELPSGKGIVLEVVDDEGDGAQTSATVPVGPLQIIDDDLAVTLATYFKSEIDNVIAERQSREEQWAEWRRMRLSQPKSLTKSFPWPKASNVEVPMMQSKINAVFSKFNKAYGSKDPFWTISSEEEGLKPGAGAFTKFIDYYSKNPYGLALAKKRRQVLYDTITFGTQVVRVPWTTERRGFKASGETATGAPTPKVMVLHDGPAISPIEIEDFFIHPYWEDIQRAPWYAIRHTLTLAELRQREAEVIYENIDEILSHGITELPQNKRDELERRGMSTQDLNAVDEFQMWEIYEIRCFWDYDGDGQYEDAILYFEPKSGKFLRSEYNPLPFRDHVVFRFLELPGEFYGLGEGEILQYLQEEITSTHNRRNDNQTLSMIQMWKKRRGVPGFEDGDIYPGKVVSVDDMGDLQPFEFPDLSSSAFQSESMARAYADEASGASSPLSGIADPTLKSGAGAASTMFLAQQSGDMLSSISDSIADSWSEVGLYIVIQFIANSDDPGASPLNDAETEALRGIFALPLEDIPSRLRLGVQVSDISQTKDAQKQNLLTVMQLYKMYGDSGMQLAQLLAPVQQNEALLATAPMRMAASLMVGSTDVMRRTLEFFGIENSQDYLPSVEDLRAQMALIDDQVDVIAGGLNAQRTASRGQAAGNGGAGIPAALPEEAMGAGLPGAGPGGNGASGPLGGAGTGGGGIPGAV
jgi:hypothetical protein